MPFQHFPLAFTYVFSGFLKCFAGLNAKHKTHSVVIPSIQFGRLSEVGVATKEDPAKACLATEFHRLVEIPSRLFVTRSVATAIDNEQWLLRIGQGNDERMVAHWPL